MGRGAWWITVYGVTRVRHDWATNIHTSDGNRTIGIKTTPSYPEGPVLMNSESNLGLHYHHWQCKRSTPHPLGNFYEEVLDVQVRDTPRSIKLESMRKEMQAPIYFKDSQMILMHWQVWGRSLISIILCCLKEINTKWVRLLNCKKPRE